MSDIFLSYVREDLERARTLAEALGAEGWSVWWDRRAHAGGRIHKIIGRQLTDARCVIVLWSERSVESDWVIDEANEAKKHEKYIPASLDRTEPPLGFRGILVRDLSGWPGGEPDANVRSLISDIEAKIGPPAPKVEEARKKAEAQRKADETARTEAEAKARRKAEEEEARREAEAEAKRRAADEEARKRTEEKRKAEAAAAQKKAEEEAKRKAAKRKAEEEAVTRTQAEAEEKPKAEEAETRRVAKEEDQPRRAEGEAPPIAPRPWWKRAAFRGIAATVVLVAVVVVGVAQYQSWISAQQEQARVEAAAKAKAKQELERRAQEAAQEERARAEAAARAKVKEEEKRRAQEAAARAKAEAEAGLSPGQTFKDCTECPEMVVVPAGSFTMGSPPAERKAAVAAGAKEEWLKGETPQHRVRIVKPFAVGKYEVTRGEYAAFVGATGRGSGDGCHIYDGEWKKDSSKSWRDPGFGQGDDDPVACVNWQDAKAYVDWLSKETGKKYRLPSEAEWEYAARAGTTTAFHFGRTISPEQANYAGNYTYDGGPKGVYREKTVPVGSFPANAFGLHDVHGNVFEWVADCFKYDAYKTHKNYPAMVGSWQDSCGRVVRGGSWLNDPGVLRSAYRFWNGADFRLSLDGFRVARTL